MNIKFRRTVYFRLCLLFLLFRPSAVSPQAKAAYFENISTEKGLSHSTVNCQVQDSRGFMWFGTEDGLNRFDGYSFKIYRNAPSNPRSISDNNIISIYEDRQGNIWTGTNQGVLNKFDPVSEDFIRFPVKTAPLFVDLQVSILSDYPVTFSRYTDKTISSITQDKEGYLWIGTWGKGLFKFDPSKGKFIKQFYTEASGGSLSSNYILSVIEDRTGILWIGTFDGGVNKLIRKQGLKEGDDKYYFVNYTSDPKNPGSLSDNRVVSLLEDKSGNIWAGTYGGGLNRIVRRYPGYLNEESSLNNSFQHILSSPASKKDGVLRGITGLNRIVKITEGKGEILWIATFGEGVVKYNYKTGEFSKPGSHSSIGRLNEKDIVALYEDRTGLLWVSTYPGRGIYRLNPLRNLFTHYRQDENNPVNSLSDNLIWAFDGDDRGNLWIGTYNGGLSRFNTLSGRFSSFKHLTGNPNSLSSNHIRAVCSDRNGLIWAGTYNSGLSLFDPVKNSCYSFRHDPSDPGSLSDNRITSLLEDSRGDIWIGTSSGIDRIQLGSLKEVKKFAFLHYKPDNLPDKRISVLYEDRKGNIWIGTQGGGLSRINRPSGSIGNYRHDPRNPNSLSDNRITAIMEDEEGNLWIGTQGGGLNKLNRKTESFTVYSAGLRSRVICGIACDQMGNLWISTDNGLCRFSPQDEKFIWFDLHNGLQSMEFSQGACYKDSKGNIYFGGINGFNRINPANLSTNKIIPPVVITSIRVLDSEVRGRVKEIILPGSGNYLSVGFAALDYTNPEQNQYACMLEGYDTSWHFSDASVLTAQYRDLPPGSYRLRIKASNSEGVWNEKGIVLPITVFPPFWKTWWFNLLGILLMGGVIAYFIYYRISHLLAIERLKTRLAADLHDNIGSGLTEISILSEVISYQMSSAPVDIKEKLGSISETSDRLIDSMSDIVWVVNPKRDSLHDLLLRLKDKSSEILSLKGITLRITNLDALKNIRLPMEYRQNLYLIFKEGINNSLKYSGCSNLTLDVHVDKRELEMILKDDGCGFDQNCARWGNGLVNMRQRAKNIGGTIEIESLINKGTAISFSGKMPGQFRLPNPFYHFSSRT